MRRHPSQDPRRAAAHPAPHLSRAGRRARRAARGRGGGPPQLGVGQRRAAHPLHAADAVPHLSPSSSPARCSTPDRCRTRLRGRLAQAPPARCTSATTSPGCATTGRSPCCTAPRPRAPFGDAEAAQVIARHAHAAVHARQALFLREPELPHPLRHRPGARRARLWRAAARAACSTGPAWRAPASPPTPAPCRTGRRATKARRQRLPPRREPHRLDRRRRARRQPRRHDRLGAPHRRDAATTPDGALQPPVRAGHLRRRRARALRLRPWPRARARPAVIGHGGGAARLAQPPASMSRPSASRSSCCSTTCPTPMRRRSTCSPRRWTKSRPRARRRPRRAPVGSAPIWSRRPGLPSASRPRRRAVRLRYGHARRRSTSATTAPPAHDDVGCAAADGGACGWIARPRTRARGCGRSPRRAPRDIAGRYRCAELDADLTVAGAGGVLYGGFSGFLGEGRMELLDADRRRRLGAALPARARPHPARRLDARLPPRRRRRAPPASRSAAGWRGAFPTCPRPRRRRRQARGAAGGRRPRPCPRPLSGNTRSALHLDFYEGDGVVGRVHHVMGDALGADVGIAG